MNLIFSQHILGSFREALVVARARAGGANTTPFPAAHFAKRNTKNCGGETPEAERLAFATGQKARAGREFLSPQPPFEAGEAEGILAWHPDRLARNSVDGGQIIYLVDTGIIKELKFPTFWFDPTPQGKFMLSIAFGQSKYYIDNLSENIKRGHRQKLKNGLRYRKTYFERNPKDYQ